MSNRFLSIGLFVFIICLLFQCSSSQSNLIMKAPETKAPALSITNGLDKSLNSNLLLEMYTRDQADNIFAIKVFADGSYYHLRKSRSKKINDPSLHWVKKEPLNQSALKDINAILNDEAQEFIASPSQKTQNRPLSFTHWYFYGTANSYAYTQKQKFRFQPKFVRKLNRKLNL